MGCSAPRSPLAVGEHPLEDRDRLIDASGVLVGDGEVVAPDQRTGVLGAEDPRSFVGEQLAPSRPPAERLGAARCQFPNSPAGLWSVCGSSAEDREPLGCLGSYARRDDLTCVPVRDGEVEMDEQLASVAERRVLGGGR